MIPPPGGTGFLESAMSFNRDTGTMRAFRNIIHIGLVLAILSTGLPLYHPGDANRDERVDLADAILRVKGVVRTAEQPAAFRSSMEDALITLSAVAGFGKVLKADRSASGSPVFSGESPYLISGFEFPPPRANPAGIAEEGLAYHSVTIAPDSPPPRSL
jgi:hypothetical protein